jgi:1,4-alpha-glucan branching enzyme
MLFMGEEWAAAQPFPFFCDFEEELAEAVRNGRRAEFAKFPEFQDEATRERIPDPTAEETFRSAKLDWSDRGRAPHAQWLDWYRRILAIRRSEIVPRLAQAAGHAGTYETSGSGAFRVSWSLGDGSGLTVLANLSDATWKGFGPSPGRVVWSEGDLDQERKALGPWSVMWSIADAANAQDVVRP